MKILFSLLKVTAFVFAFIFFSANFVSAFNWSIWWVTTTEPYIDWSNQYNFPIKIDNINYKGDNLKFEYSSNSWASWNSFSWNTFKNVVAWEKILNWNLVSIWNSVISKDLSNTSAWKQAWMDPTWKKEHDIVSFTTLEYTTIIESLLLKWKTNWWWVALEVKIYDWSWVLVWVSNPWNFSYHGDRIVPFNFSSNIELKPNSNYQLKIRSLGDTWSSVSIYYNDVTWDKYYQMKLKWIDDFIYNTNSNLVKNNHYLWVSTIDAIKWNIFKIQTFGDSLFNNTLPINNSIYTSETPGKFSTQKTINSAFVWVTNSHWKLTFSKWFFNDVWLESNVDFSNLPEWDNTLLFRAKDINGNYSNYSKLMVFKSSKPIISINNDNSSVGDFKNYTATANIWKLWYAITKSNICDNSLVFTDYKPIRLNDSKYNSYKICFRAIVWNSITYKFSNQIDWIRWFNSIIKNGDVFHDYIKWKNSTQIKDHDNSLAFLKMMQTSSRTTSTQPVTKNFPSTLIDINWDGLVDMLYSNYDRRVENRFNGTSHYKYPILTYKYAIMINNWDYTFTPVYRCLQEDGKYYGNCAE